MGKQSFFKRAATAAKVSAKYVFGYDAVKNTRYRRTRGNEPIRSEDIELKQYDRDKLVSTCLDFRRNNPVVASISRLRKADVVGRGIYPQPQTGDDELDKEIERRWLGFCESPEVSGQMDMRELQQMAVDSLLFFGDCGTIKRADGKLQYVEGSSIANPQGVATGSESSNWQNGVRVSDSGTPLAYSIGRRVSGIVRDQKPVRASNFEHFMRRQRAGQYRGIPELAPIVNVLQDIDEYDKIEMIAAKAAAAFSVNVERENADSYLLANQIDSDEQDSEGRLESIEPGSVNYLEPGETTSIISTNGRPNVDGVQWTSYLLRKAGAPLGIPLEFLLMEIGGSSFSASQGVVLQYQQTVESYQSDLIRWMDRIYRWWINNQIADGNISATDIDAARRVRWQRPAFRWINKAAQVKADMEYFRAGAMSLDDIVAPFGYTADDVLMRKAQNIRRAKEIAEASGIEDWRELINPFQTSISGSYAEVVQGDSV